MIVIIVFIIVLGIIAVHFGFQSKKEQRKINQLHAFMSEIRRVCGFWEIYPFGVELWRGYFCYLVTIQIIFAYFCSCFLWRNGELHYFFGIIFVIPLFFCMMEKFAITIR